MAPEGDERKGLSRRRTLQGMGAVLGAVGIGCGDDGTDDGVGDGTSGTGSGSGSGGSTSGAADSSGSDGGTVGGSTGPGGSSEESTGEPVDECGSGSAGLSPQELLAEIDTIVVVMMENRSFDHYFGSATFLEGLAVDGLTGRETNPRLDGTPVPVFAMDNLQPADPPHGWDDCHLQWNLGA
ncbi:MAG: alkaline phosphatase family protein, partial [Nannocystaceae bacterium]